MSEKNIPVLDSQNRFLSYTSPARARILIKQERAFAFNKKPFILKMKEDDEVNMSKLSAKKLNPSLNFTQFFKNECDLYLQNISQFQISIEFSPNVSFRFPKTKRPVNLTSFVSFQDIKESHNFRRMLSRRPPIMRLLTEEEYVSWYEERAAANGTSLEDELGKTEDLLRGIEPEQTTSTQRMKAKEEEALEKKKEEILKAREPLPRLVHLCAAADGEGASGVSEEDFMDELDSLSDQMTAEDLEFVASRGVYPAVKKFAREKLESL